MINIFKSMSYRILKSKIAVYSLFSSIIFTVTFIFMALSDESGPGIYGIWDNYFFTMNLLAMISICAYNCTDFTNKTINLEVMNGHSPIEICVGRTLALGIFIEIIFHICLIIVMVAFKTNTANTLLFSNHFVKRLLNMELLFISFIVFYSFCSFISRNALLSLMTSWLGFVVSVIIVFLDDIITLPNDMKLSSLIGSGIINNALLAEYNSTIFTINISISLISIIFFIILNILTFKNTEL